MKTITKNQFLAKVANYKNQIFYVTFIKKDESVRTILCRIGIKSKLKGGTLPYDPKEKGLLPVFDMTLQAYRMINMAGIVGATINKTNYIIE